MTANWKHWTVCKSSDSYIVVTQTGRMHMLKTYATTVNLAYCRNTCPLQYVQLEHLFHCRDMASRPLAPPMYRAMQCKHPAGLTALRNKRGCYSCAGAAAAGRALTTALMLGCSNCSWHKAIYLLPKGACRQHRRCQQQAQMMLHYLIHMLMHHMQILCCSSSTTHQATFADAHLHGISIVN
eukprot:GHRR01008615.1.p1 GENE.GHRR01008615.1~~GHRR01008615.1.p1  ORF type:complete len:182 (-),score=41.04 GHRR01008615.1:986-1531(-)